MRPIQLPRASSITAVESLLAQLDDAPEDLALVIPNTLTGRAFAGTSAMLQFIVTWRRRCPRGRLCVHVQDRDDDSRAATVLDNLTKRDHGLVALAVAGDVWSRTGSRPLTDLVRPRIDARFAGMNDISTVLRGAKAFIAAWDFTPHDAPAPFYHPRNAGSASDAPVVRSRSEFESAAEWRDLYRRLWAGSTVGAPPSDTTTGPQALGSVLYELIDNTHRWAVTDGVGRRLPSRTSLRGFRIERHNVPAGEQASWVEDEPMLRQYLDHPELAPEDDRQRLLELVVFDCGPGLAARWTRVGDVRELSIEEEDKAVRECLAKRGTSSGNSFQGLGLHRVLTLVSAMGGFLRLRTGRLQLCRDFVAKPYDPAQVDHEPFLNDWRVGSGGPTEAPLVAGTFLTALLPLRHAR